MLEQPHLDGYPSMCARVDLGYDCIPSPGLYTTRKATNININTYVKIKEPCFGMYVHGNMQDNVQESSLTTDIYHHGNMAPRDEHETNNGMISPFDTELDNSIAFESLEMTGMCTRGARGKFQKLQKSTSLPIPEKVREANNVSARKYRNKKKEEMEHLRKQCAVYEAYNLELQKVLHQSMKKIEQLESQIQELTRKKGD